MAKTLVQLAVCMSLGAFGLLVGSCKSLNNRSRVAGSETQGGFDPKVNRPNPGLVSVTFDSTVGVLLDDIPDPNFAQRLLKSNPEAKGELDWKERAIRQMRLTTNRMYFRGGYYEGGLSDHHSTPEDEEALAHPTKGQLPVPPEFDEDGKELWIDGITLVSKPELKVIDGHRLIARRYHYQGFLLSDEASPGLTEPALAKTGGTWAEPKEGFALPIDPDYLLQRTGYACMGEVEFPPNSVDSVNAWHFYDFTCEANDTSEDAGSCHVGKNDPGYSGRNHPNESCLQALTRSVGIVPERPSLQFKRLDPDPKVSGVDLDKVRVNDPSASGGADLAVRQDSLEENRIVWRYIAKESCEMLEENNCVAGPGWRRLLEFDAVGHNVGTKPLHIGPINYDAKDPTRSSQNDQNGVFRYSTCHRHFHFSKYGTFSLGDGNVTNRKNGFCLESTTRLSNNEYTPLETQYGRCILQGVEAGWGDEYEAGIPCQWVDITDHPSGEVNLSFHSNPQGYLCEGSLVDKDGQPTFDHPDARGLPTPISLIDNKRGWEQEVGTDGKPEVFTPIDFAGKPLLNSQGAPEVRPVKKPLCQLLPGWDRNNERHVPVTILPVGGLVAAKCKNTNEVGPLRDCGFQHETPANPRGTHSCSPGNEVRLSCSTKSARPQVVRVCEASANKDIGGSMDCMYVDALRLGADATPAAATVSQGRAVTVEFNCPEARDTEPGGSYSIYTGAFFAHENAGSVRCEVAN